MKLGTEKQFETPPGKQTYGELLRIYHCEPIRKDIPCKVTIQIDKTLFKKIERLKNEIRN